MYHLTVRQYGFHHHCSQRLQNPKQNGVWRLQSRVWGKYLSIKQVKNIKQNIYFLIFQTSERYQFSKPSNAIWQALGPDKVVRAVKMVNTLGMEGEINREELRWHPTSSHQAQYLFLSTAREVKLLETLRDVKSVARLICYEVVRSQVI